MLRYVYSSPTAAPCLPISTLLCYIYFFYATVSCLLFPHSYAMSSLSSLHYYVYSFHTATLWLLFHAAAPCLIVPRCCTISTFSGCCTLSYLSTLLCHVYKFLFHTAVTCLLLQHCCVMFTFPRCCTLSSLSPLLCHVNFFHAATPCLLSSRCFTMPTLSTVLRRVFFFHAAPCLLYLH